MLDRIAKTQPAIFHAYSDGNHDMTAWRYFDSSITTLSTRRPKAKHCQSLLDHVLGPLACLAALLGPSAMAAAQTTLSTPGFNVQSIPAATNGTDSSGAPLTAPAAVVYGNGSLYSVPGPNYNISDYPASFNEVNVYTGSASNPWSTISLQNTNGFTGFVGPSGAAWNPVTNSLLVVDDNFNTNTGAVYSVNVAPGVNQGAVSTVATFPNDPYLQQVTVQPVTGNVFVTDANSSSPAGIYAISGSSGAVSGPLVTSSADGLAGVAVQTSGSTSTLVYQDVTYNYSGGVPSANVMSATLASTNTAIVGSPSTAPGGTGVASYDLAVSSDNKTYVTGSVVGPNDSSGNSTYYYGLFQLGQTSNAYGSIFAYQTGSPYDAAESLAYLPGSAAFGPYAGASGGQMAFVLSDGSGSSGAAGTYVYLVTPVPEPSTLVLLAVGAIGFLAALRGRHRQPAVGLVVDKAVG